MVQQWVGGGTGERLRGHGGPIGLIVAIVQGNRNALEPSVKLIEALALINAFDKFLYVHPGMQSQS